MKFLLFPVIAVFVYCANAQPKFINVKGRELVGIDGKPFLMKGTNLGNWLVPEGYMFKFRSANSPRLINEVLCELIGPEATGAFWKKYLDSYITERDILFLKKIGVNSIRIPFNYRLFTDEYYLGAKGPGNGFRLLDSVVKWCKKQNIFIVLDMHCAPGGQTGDNIDDGWGYPFLFESEESQQLAVSVWRRIAAHFSNENAIIGYDLLNEPIAHYFDKEKLNPLLERLYRKIAKEIRAVDKNHLLFLGGAQWDSNFGVFGPPFDDKLVYTFHKYWTDPSQQVIQEYIDFSKKYNVPIYCGETGENTDEWINTFRKILDQNNIGWHFWPYKKIDNTRAILTFQTPHFYRLITQFADTPRTSFEAIRKTRPSNVAQVTEALDGFLKNCQFTDCMPNKDYIEALGFKYDGQ